MTKNTPPSKQTAFEEAMAGDHALIHLDSSRPGVEVPSHLQGNHALTLKLSYNFQGETTHDEKEVVTYLRFSGTYQRCVLPWSAIWGITGADGKNTIWPQDLPLEIVKRMALEKLGELKNRFLSKVKDPKSATSSTTKSAAGMKQTTDTPPTTMRKNVKLTEVQTLSLAKQESAESALVAKALADSAEELRESEESPLEVASESEDSPQKRERRVPSLKRVK